MDKLIAGSLFKHYTGYFYKIVCTAEHAETKETMVIYSSLYDNKIYSLAVNKFTSYITPTKQRFTYISPLQFRHKY